MIIFKYIPDRPTDSALRIMFYIWPSGSIVGRPIVIKTNLLYSFGLK